MARSETTLRIDTKQITLVLKMPRLFSVRMWLTIKVLKLAAIVSPVTIELEYGHD